MRLAISNLAWEPAEDVEVARLLRQNRVDAIDVAPGKYFGDPATATAEQMQAVRQWWADHGIQITGMQGLLFGTRGLNVFGAPEVQTALLDHLRAVCRIGRGLGAQWLVFGSPRQRDRSGLTDAQAADTAVAFFRRAGDIAAEQGVTLCLEPNPPRYGANFMTTAAETASIVSAVDHPGIRMQFDTGALTIQEESAQTILALCASRVAHVHASEPDLVTLGDGGTDHATMGQALRRWLPHHVVCVEMLPAAHEPHVQAIERALRVALQAYGPGPEGAA